MNSADLNREQVEVILANLTPILGYLPQPFGNAGFSGR
jgi:hypothetical protein